METVKPLTVYYDGACPLCIREISLLRKLDAKRSRIMFENIAEPGALPSCDISQAKLMARFHIKTPEGDIIDGAQAFTEAWAQISYMGWLRPIGRFAPTRFVLNCVYSLFLKLRPSIQRTLKR